MEEEIVELERRLISSISVLSSYLYIPTFANIVDPTGAVLCGLRTLPSQRGLAIQGLGNDEETQLPVNDRLLLTIMACIDDRQISLVQTGDAYILGRPIHA